MTKVLIINNLRGACPTCGQRNHVLVLGGKSPSARSDDGTAGTAEGVRAPSPDGALTHGVAPGATQRGGLRGSG
jgi:hypothetical protein